MTFIQPPATPGLGNDAEPGMQNIVESTARCGRAQGRAAG